MSIEHNETTWSVVCKYRNEAQSKKTLQWRVSSLYNFFHGIYLSNDTTET